MSDADVETIARWIAATGATPSHIVVNPTYVPTLIAMGRKARKWRMRHERMARKKRRGWA